MTMAEGMVGQDALAVTDGRLALSLRLPWYRSLPIACLESVDVTVNGAAAPILSVQVPEFAGSVAEVGDSQAPWDLRDPLDVVLDAPGRAGQVYDLHVALAIRIPYIKQAPGVPLVQRAAAHAEVTAR